LLHLHVQAQLVEAGQVHRRSVMALLGMRFSFGPAGLVCCGFFP